MIKNTAYTHQMLVEYRYGVESREQLTENFIEGWQRMPVFLRALVNEVGVTITFHSDKSTSSCNYIGQRLELSTDSFGGFSFDDAAADDVVRKSSQHAADVVAEESLHFLDEHYPKMGVATNWLDNLLGRKMQERFTLQPGWLEAVKKDVKNPAARNLIALHRETSAAEGYRSKIMPWDYPAVHQKQYNEEMMSVGDLHELRFIPRPDKPEHVVAQEWLPEIYHVQQYLGKKGLTPLQAEQQMQEAFPHSFPLFTDFMQKLEREAAPVIRRYQKEHGDAEGKYAARIGEEKNTSQNQR